MVVLSNIASLQKKNPVPINLTATCRNKSKAEELQKIASEHSNVHVLEFDVLDTEQVAKIVKDNGLNVLFNNGGMTPKSTRINFVQPEQMVDTFKVNTVAPLMLSKTFLPLLKMASTKHNDKPLGVTRAAIINMSSSLGSIKLNTDGGLYPYRCAKIASNIATKSLSVDLKKDGILAVAFHPGWVKTDMGGSTGCRYKYIKYSQTTSKTNFRS